MAYKYRIIFEDCTKVFGHRFVEIINLDAVQMSREELDAFAIGYCRGLEKVFDSHWMYKIEEIIEK